MPEPTDDDYRQQHRRVEALIGRLGEVAGQLEEFDAAAFDLVRADLAGIGELAGTEERDFAQSLASAGQHTRMAHRILRFYRARLEKVMEGKGISFPATGE